MILLMSFSRMVIMVLVLWGFEGQNYVALLQKSEIPAKLCSREFILGIEYPH